MHPFLRGSRDTTREGDAGRRQAAAAVSSDGDTCFGTHHLVFAEDANHRLSTSSGGGGGAVGWLNTKLLDETHDEEKAQGWRALILDTNSNGSRDE
jgi:hypothetical protein